jgi:uncharacterized protein (TIGR00255 family)
MMISMTGYGKSSVSNNHISIECEIRTVNSRYLDYTPKLPRIFFGAEQEVVQLIKKNCVRGKVYLNFDYELAGDASSVPMLNVDKLENYRKLVEDLKNHLGVDEDISIEKYLTFSDIIQNKTVINDEEIFGLLIQSIEIALTDLSKMRETEGKILQSDIDNRIKKVEYYVSDIQQYSEENRQNAINKYRLKVEELINGIVIDESRLLQEIAIMSEKKDITEEIIRFNSHVVQWKKLYDWNQQGKKMTFLLQEMGREINTIGSKTDNVDVSHLVVDIKDELEKIREQVQNIL